MGFHRANPATINAECGHIYALSRDSIVYAYTQDSQPGFL